MLIRRCTALPSNFPVTDGMVSLRGQRSLQEEMKVPVLTLIGPCIGLMTFKFSIAHCT